MAKYAHLGTCPFCFVEVWKDFGEIMRPVINKHPLQPAEVIPALKARRELFRKIDAIHTMFTWVDPLPIARELKAGGALPTYLYALHEHQAFTPNEPPDLLEFPTEPGF